MPTASRVGTPSGPARIAPRNSASAGQGRPESAHLARGSGTIPSPVPHYRAPATLSSSCRTPAGRRFVTCYEAEKGGTGLAARDCIMAAAVAGGRARGKNDSGNGGER